MNENILPNSLEAEEVIIACFLVSEDTWKYIDRLEAEDFFNPQNKTLFILIKELYTEKNPINIITVKEKGVSRKIDGTKLLLKMNEIINDAAFTWRIDYYIKILKNLSIKRKIYKKASEICKEIFDFQNDVDDIELKNYALNQFINIKTENKTTQGEMKDVMIETVKDIQDKYQKRDDLTYRTGYFDLDKITDGLHEQELTIIAARPGVGKTAFALQMAEHIAKKGVYTYFASLEMSKKQLGNRLIARDANIDGHKLRMGWLEETDFDKIIAAASDISETPIFIDADAQNIQEIETKTMELKQERNLGLIVIDYLQLLKNKGKFTNREQEVADISRRLKLLSKNLDVPVIALCQLNREAEKRKRPMLADLRESGSIEQDADNVIFLYTEEDEKNKNGIIESEIIVAKQRNGPTGMVRIRFNKKQMTFINLAGGL